MLGDVVWVLLPHGGTPCPPRAEQGGLERSVPPLTLTQCCSGMLPVALLVPTWYVPSWWKPSSFPGCKSGFPIKGVDN